MTLLRRPEVARLAVSAVTTRITAPLLSLGLLLAVNSSLGSYGSAAGVLSGYAGALAVAVPVAGRLVDRLRPRRVLACCLLANLAAYAVLLWALTRHAPVGVLIASAAALGATTPPSGPVVRSSWPVLVSGEQLKTAFALDAVLNEVMFVTGPLIVSGLVAFASPDAAVVFAACATTAGVLLLMTVSLPPPKAERAERRLLGPLSHGQVRVLLGIVVCDTVAYGGIVVAVAALGGGDGSGGASGVLLSVLSLGTVISALIYGARERNGRPGPQLALYHAASTALLLIGAQVSHLVWAALILLVVGAVGGPRDTLHQVVLGEAAPEEYRTEAFAWMSTFMWAGYALGTSLSGQLVSANGGSHTWAFIGAAAAAGLASAVSLLVRPVLATTGTASDVIG
ncbi:MFS transporter [Streptomyces sp. NPDC021098]|uniref:MFS transporter n=1 Tax=unclassified Streptomyces TaxID=2593676 RepID=UPI0037923901